VIQIKSTASGKEYTIGKLERGYPQYMDRLYMFNYIPEELRGCAHFLTCGNDKMIPEDQPCFSLEMDSPADVYVLYADKHPVLPKWLMEYERTRMNVTRLDTSASDLKGYFSLYKKGFPAGIIQFYGNSTHEMLDQDWYVNTNGGGYCMYTVAVINPSSTENVR